MTDEAQIESQVAEESSPRHKHLRKLAAEAEALKKHKESNSKPTKTEYEVVYDTRGKPKYRRITYMPSGNKYWTYVDPKSSELSRVKALQGKKKLG